ncbi:hypothetical protein ACN47E_006119 [Coniothyrium glycines]
MSDNAKLSTRGQKSNNRNVQSTPKTKRTPEQLDSVLASARVRVTSAKTKQERQQVLLQFKKLKAEKDSLLERLSEEDAANQEYMAELQAKKKAILIQLAREEEAERLKGLELYHEYKRKGTKQSKAADSTSFDIDDILSSALSNAEQAGSREKHRMDQDGGTSSVLPKRKLRDTLRLPFTTPDVVPIDQDLSIDFSASVEDLQQQILHMQDRLKTSYPRIDTLPYEVWTSQNTKSLQTWLKILVSRWKTRFDDFEETARLDGPTQAVLDEMVRQHNLSNEAAERMAGRFIEVFRRDADLADDVDWDEFYTEGMGFLAEEDEGIIEQDPARPGATPRALSNVRKTKEPVYSSITKRLYSTLRCPSSHSHRPFLTPPTNNPIRHSSSSSSDSPPPSLPHLTSTGSAHMVSVSAKPHTTRTAIAVGTVHFTNPDPLSLIRSNSLKKGDVLSVSRIAGIMAAKKCPDIVPLCHPISLTHVSVDLTPFPATDSARARASAPQSTNHGSDNPHGGVAISAKVQCTGPTGVEMEALTAVMGAALSVVDMCKAVDKSQRIGNVRVVLKDGGRSGAWREPGWES